MNRGIVAGVLASLLLMPDVSSLAYTARIKDDLSHTVEAERNQWKGKKVAFLGDSITDKARIGTTKCYWEYLEEMLGIEAISYAINGNQMDGLLKQAEFLLKERGQDIDAIMIFAGTNDYNSSIPLGNWFHEEIRNAPVAGGKTEARTYRSIEMTSKTFRGRINQLMDFLKTNFPGKQIIMLTPIHRAFATFGENNVQPEEGFSNERGLFLDSYVKVIKEAAEVWAVPVIDLNSLSGLYPVNDSYVQYFHDKNTDRLHPNADGHRRMALALKYQLLAFPATFE